MSAAPQVIVEFFGIPRQRAGRAELTICANNAAELLTRIEEHCPQLNGLRDVDGRLSKQYLLSINGERFVTDTHELLEPGQRILLLSADAGG